MDEPDRSGTGGHRFPRSRRVRRAAEIRALHARGRRERTTHLDVFFLASPASRSRFGTVVPKHRHRIVDRNRLRRQLREIGRTEVLPRLEARELHVDVLVRARKEAYGAGYADLRGELVEWLEDAWCAAS